MLGAKDQQRKDSSDEGPEDNINSLLAKSTALNLNANYKKRIVLHFQCVEYIRVLMDCPLYFRHHIDHISSRGAKRSGLIHCITSSFSAIGCLLGVISICFESEALNVQIFCVRPAKFFETYGNNLVFCPKMELKVAPGLEVFGIDSRFASNS